MHGPREGEATLAAGAQELDSTLVGDLEREDPTLLPGSHAEPTQVPGTASPDAASPDADRPAGQAAPRGGSMQLLAGRFEVSQVLGEGGMGKVFRVRDRQIEGREVALKVLRPRFSRNAKFRELFFKEICAAQSFVSEHVNQVRDTGQMEDGKLFLTMDLVEGESLAALLDRERVLVPRHALEIARQILAGLHSGHEKGFIHRDVKPANVMLATRVPKTEDNPAGVGVRILDFGIAGIAADVEQGKIAGTPKYMSPEQVTGERLDPRSDLFSVGVVLYEMISGQRPFEGDTLQEMETALLETSVAPLIGELEDLPPAIAKILRKALRKDRTKRYQSAAEFIQAIESSTAFKEERGTPAWVGILTGLLIVGAAAEGYQILRLDNQLGRAGVTNEDLRGQVQGLLNDESFSAAELAGARRDGNAAGVEAGRKAEAENYPDYAAKNEFYDKYFADIEGKQELVRLRNLEEQYLELKNQMAKMETAYGELKETYESEEAISSEAFDRMLLLINSGQPGLAQGVIDRVSREKGLFLMDDAAGAFAAELISTATALAEVRTADGESGVREAALTRAEGNRASAIQRLETLRRLDPGWLAYVRPARRSEGAAPPDRLQAAGRTLELLARASVEERERLDVVEVQHEVQVEDRWQAFLDQTADADPRPAIAFALENGRDLDPLIDRFHAQLVASAVTSGGSLDLSALRSSTWFAEWARFLTDEGRTVQTSEADDIRRLWGARLWYLDGVQPTGQLFTLCATVPTVREAEPHVDWSAQFALQLGFLEEGTWPPPSGTITVVRNTWTKDGTWSWYIHTRPTAVEGGWNYTRRIYNSEGKPLGGEKEKRVRRVGFRYLLQGEDLSLDLTEHDTSIVKVALWKSAPPDLPASAWIPEFPLAAFKSEVDGNPLPCLVILRGEKEYWFSPACGLVRERTEDYHREMVYRPQ